MPKTPLSLLLVEDSQDDAALLLHALKCGDYDVTSERVDSAEEMRAMLSRVKWDLVISDYSMPSFTGLDALAIFNEANLGIPFILISGTVGEETAVRAMKAGASDYLMKDKLMRLVPTVQRELREAANRVSLKEKENELRQAQKMEVIGQLAGSVAHDFNNLLGVSLMYCDLLLGKIPETDPLSDDVVQIKKASERAATLTRQLLAFSRKQALEPKVLNLNLVISNIEKMLRAFIGEHIKLTTALDPSLGQVKVDPGQIEQMLMNLAVNSRDAMPKGGSLELKTENVELSQPALGLFAVPPGKYVVITVSDTGCGMDLKTQARIFEPFFTTKSARNGTGLGLATVYGIVNQSKGHITVESQLGQGATFKVFFPQLDLPPEPLDLATPRKAGSERSGHTILLLEDERALRLALRKCLEQKGYTVLNPATSAEAAEAVAASGKSIDLLVTDVVMPQISGPDLAARLVAAQPKMKVLFVSGYLDDTLEAFNIVRDRASFLQKPFSSDVFLQKIEDILAKSDSSA